jgi:hypothetical protein
MSLPGLLKRQTSEPPAEVIQAASELHGISPQRIASIQAEQLSALSPFLWGIKLNERSSAIVVYIPGEMPVAAPWFEESVMLGFSWASDTIGHVSDMP